jgi:adenylyltransferase/sulfurtransferase
MVQMVEMERYFKRQIELWGVEKQKLLSTKRILIIGAGGLGSSLSFALGSVGIGEISIVDFDEVAIHNIHRQIAFSLENRGEFKAEVIKKRIESKSTFTKVSTFIESFETFKDRIDLDKFDLIFDATDNISTRLEIDKFAKSRDEVWVHGSVEAFYGQVAIFDKASFSIFSTNLDHKPKGVSTPIVMNVASLQANLGLKFLLGEDVKRDILYILSFDKENIFSTKSFKLIKDS